MSNSILFDICAFLVIISHDRWNGKEYPKFYFLSKLFAFVFMVKLKECGMNRLYHGIFFNGLALVSFFLHDVCGCDKIDIPRQNIP